MKTLSRLGAWVANGVRWIIFMCLRWTPYHDKLMVRMRYREVGTSGHVSVFDAHVCEERNLHPLNRFEKWYLRPTILGLKGIHRDMFRSACIEVLGEEPDTDWA